MRRLIAVALIGLCALTLTAGCPSRIDHTPGTVVARETKDRGHTHILVVKHSDGKKVNIRVPGDIYDDCQVDERWPGCYLSKTHNTVDRVALAAYTVTVAPTTYVDIAVASTWLTPAYGAVNWVDYYTRSNMVVGHCRTGYKCITIREVSHPGYYAWTEYAAHSYYVSSDRAHIELDPHWRYLPDWKQRRIISHELGHANGITWHNRYWCSGIMMAGLYCSPGVYPPWRFTAPQRDRLAVN